MDRASLTDFGLARTVATGSKLTRTGEALGTPAYMSPEQARGEAAALTAATDVWGLGCVLFETLAGRSPWQGESPAALVGKVLFERVPPIRGFRPDAPAGLARVLRKALAKDPRRRYGDAAALRDDLDRVLAGRSPRARSRTPAAALVASAAGLVALAVLARGGAAPGPANAVEPGTEALAARAETLARADPRAAADLLARALDAAPTRHDWRVRRGLLLWALGENGAAREEWSRVLPEADEGPAARLYLGLEALFRAEGRFLRADQARPHLEVAARAPGREGRLARAALALARQDWRTMGEEIGSETGWEAHLLRAYAATLAPDGSAEAVRRYSDALASGMPFAWAYHHRGVARLAIRDFAGAEEDFTEALRIVPGLADPRMARARARIELGRADEAEDDLARAVAADSTLGPAAGTVRATILERRGDLAGAVAILDEALRQQPADYAARMNRGRLRLRSGNVAGAVEDFDVAVAAKPGEPLAFSNRAEARRLSGDRAGASEDCETALRLRPAFPSALVNRGVLRIEGGDLSAGIQDLTEALRRDPDNPEALAARSVARIATGDLAAAIEDCEAALRIVPGQPMALANRGRARRETGDLPGSEADYQAAIRAAPSVASFHSGLAVTRHRRRDWSGATESLREFLRLAPEDPWVPTARAMLADCEARLAAGR